MHDSSKLNIIAKNNCQPVKYYKLLQLIRILSLKKRCFTNSLMKYKKKGGKIHHFIVRNFK